jgi:hypothetical protein
MAETTPMTLRIDAEIKAAAERAAAASGVTLTEFVVRALKGASNPVCPTCGRSSPNTSVPPAFTPAFEELHRTLCGPATNQPFVLFTIEGPLSKVYWGRLPSIEPLRGHAGVIEIDAFVGWQRPAPDWILPSKETHRIAVPRGAIQGWQIDPEGRLYAAQCALGYSDGNEPARRAFHAQMSERLRSR